MLLEFIPLSVWCGVSWMFSLYIVLDNGNVGFIIIGLIVNSLIDWVACLESCSYTLLLLFFVLFLLLIACFSFMLLLWFFIGYELLVIIFFFLLLFVIVSFYRIRTAFYFFIYSLFGSFVFIFSNVGYLLSSFSPLFYSSSFSIPSFGSVGAFTFTLFGSSSFTLLLFSFSFITMFLIKLPSFPFFYWLPEVHCEASTALSLFLAALLLKLGIYGLLRYVIPSLFYTFLFYFSSLLLLLLLVGILLSISSSFRFIDFKKLIAFSSILHLQICFTSLLSLNSSGLLCSLIVAFAHGFSSLSLFLFVGLVISRTYSRLVDSLWFLNGVNRGLFLFFILFNISFPGSFNFVGELLSIIAIVSIDYIFALFVLLSSFLSSLLWLLILNRKLPYHSFYFSFNYVEFFVFLFLILVVVITGCYFIL